MINFLICLIISVFLSYGMAILIVEKGKEWPIKPWRIRLQLILHKINWKLSKMLFCTTCTSFWATFFSDFVICFVSYFLEGHFIYFFWPFSGIICAGIVWSIIEYLNSIDKEQNINIFVDSGDKKNEN